MWHYPYQINKRNFFSVITTLYSQVPINPHKKVDGARVVYETLTVAEGLTSFLAPAHLCLSNFNSSRHVLILNFPQSPFLYS